MTRVSSSSEAINRGFYAKNSLKRVGFQVKADGTAMLHDHTNGKDILINALNGTNTFNGTASGNLPLDGGGTVSAYVDTPFIVKTTSPNQKGIYIGYELADGSANYIGFNNGEAYVYNKGAILHTGNITDYITTDTEVGTFNLKVGNATLSGYEYTKIGKFVYLSGSVPYSGDPLSLDSGVEVSGLPFAMGSIPYLYFGTSIYIPTNKATDNLVNHLGTTLGTTFQIGKSTLTTSLANGTPCILHAMYITE